MKRFVVLMLIFAVFIGTVEIFASARNFNEVLDVAVEKTLAEHRGEIAELLGTSDFDPLFPERTPAVLPSVINADRGLEYSPLNQSVYRLFVEIQKIRYTWTIGSVG